MAFVADPAQTLGSHPALRAPAPARAAIHTLGLEEELQVVGPDGELSAHDIARGQREVPDENGTSSCEIHRCVLEVQTPVCRGPDEIVASLAGMRAVAARRAQAQGQRVLAAGLHPFSRWIEQPLHDDPHAYPHYAHLLHEFGDVARGAMSFGLHVHVATSRPELRMPVMNRLRNVLPDLLALSASAPFCEGRDTGLQTWRHSLLGRYPRMGMPDAWESEEAYWAHVRRLQDAGSLEVGHGLWEDLRIHHRYRTLEVRIADATPSLARVWLLVALVHAEVATLEAEILAGRAPETQPRALLEDNKWRARRHGMQAELVDWTSGQAAPFDQRLFDWLARLEPAATHLGFAQRLQEAAEEALLDGTAADQQRVWLKHSGSLQQVVEALIRETAAPLPAYLHRDRG